MLQAAVLFAFPAKYFPNAPGASAHESVGDVLLDEQREDPAEAAMEARAVGVGVEDLPEGLVRRPGQRLVAVAPRGAEADPDRRPRRGAVPGSALLLDEATAYLELPARAVQAVGRRTDRPHPHVEH